MRFEFGNNWKSFINNNFTKERLEIAEEKLRSLLQRDSLKDLSFIDIGCGSGTRLIRLGYLALKINKF